MPAPDVVLVGYLGHFDVHLARFLFRRVPVVLDHLTGASDTARDRRLGGFVRQVLLKTIDAGALSAADIVVVDTEEHLARLPERHQARAVVVPVGAPSAWHLAARPAGQEDTGRPLRVVFYGLYTPLQGAPVIGAALGRIAGAPLEVTMIGGGQDKAVTMAAAGTSEAVRWLDWVPAAELPALVASHDVCLGIFGTGDKALRVVPNKVFQGAAAECAIVTSDTARSGGRWPVRASWCRPATRTHWPRPCFGWPVTAANSPGCACRRASWLGGSSYLNESCSRSPASLPRLGVPP